MTTISAKTILRSRNAAAPDKVLSTLLLRYPRFIHAEMLTHRAFSRNAASSRAIPVKKMIEDILADTAMPIHWGAKQSGMQAYEQCDNLLPLGLPLGSTREQAWMEARNCAIEIAQAFDTAGYAKQVVNRLLEPFLHITVLVSSTEWSNFLELRDHHAAEPHIQMLAREVRKCLDDESEVQTLRPGEWHLPFMTREESVDIYSTYKGDDHLKAMIKVSVARAASTSYKTVDGFDMTLDRAVALHDRLVGSRPLHASPCEHVAQADSIYDGYVPGHPGAWTNKHQHGNYNGFRQYRHMLEVSA